MDVNPSPHIKPSKEAMAAIMSERRREREEAERQRPIDQAEGLEALKRLLPIAKGRSGQCRRVAAFLLAIYNGTRFPLDLTMLRGLDQKIFDDCLAVLRMDHIATQEVHTYFQNGGAIWERLAADWKIGSTKKDEPVGHGLMTSLA